MTLEEQVYSKLLKVPPGKITTYVELARAVGLYNGQRQIGRIMSKNPYPGIVPCHRVVRSNGEVGGYLYGTKIKTNMLVGEGVDIQNGRIKNIKDQMYRF